MMPKTISSKSDKFNQINVYTFSCIPISPKCFIYKNDLRNNLENNLLIFVDSCLWNHRFNKKEGTQNFLVISMFSNRFFLCFRTSFAQNEEASQEQSRRQTTQNSLLQCPAAETQARVQREQIPDRETETATQRRIGTERSSDQDMVPEQAGQDQEIFGPEECLGATVDGARFVQPFYGTLWWRRHALAILILKSFEVC